MSLKTTIAKLRRELEEMSPKGLSAHEYLTALGAILFVDDDDVDEETCRRLSAADRAVLENAARRTRGVKALPAEQLSDLHRDPGALIEEMFRHRSLR